MNLRVIGELLRVWGLAFCLVEGTSYAGSYKLVTLEKAEVTGAQYLYNRDPQTPKYEPDAYDKYVEMQLAWNHLGVLFMENRLHLSSLKTGEVKTAGWQWAAGVQMSKEFSLLYMHHSQHILDEPQQVPGTRTNRFPVQDSWGLRMTIWEDKTSRNGLFK